MKKIQSLVYIEKSWQKVRYTKAAWIIWFRQCFLYKKWKGEKWHEEKVALEKLEDAKAFAEELKEKSITVSIKTGSGGRSFGSVSTKELAAAAKAQLGYDLDKKKMVLDVPIKSPGIFTMPIKLHPQVTGKLHVKVVEA